MVVVVVVVVGFDVVTVVVVVTVVCVTVVCVDVVCVVVLVSQTVSENGKQFTFSAVFGQVAHSLHLTEFWSVKYLENSIMNERG